MTPMIPSDYMARLTAAFDSVFNPRPVTAEEGREQARLVARQRERDEARRTGAANGHQQPLLPR